MRRDGLEVFGKGKCSRPLRHAPSIGRMREGSRQARPPPVGDRPMMCGTPSHPDPKAEATGAAMVEGQPAYKPGSVRRLAPPGDHSSGTPLARRLKQPTRTTDPEKGWRFPAASFLFGFAPGGVCPAAAIAGSAVGSYPTVSPLPPSRSRGRFVFCGTFPGVTPAGRYPAPFLRGARTFLPRRLSTYDGSGRPAGWRA